MALQSPGLSFRLDSSKNDMLSVPNLLSFKYNASQATGFLDAAGAQRTIPFEVMVPGDKIPVYEETLEDNGRFNDQPALPFNAYGTMALARGEFETNSGSSQFFFLLKVGCLMIPVESIWGDLQEIEK